MDDNHRLFHFLSFILPYNLGSCINFLVDSRLKYATDETTKTDYPCWLDLNRYSSRTLLVFPPWQFDIVDGRFVFPSSLKTIVVTLYPRTVDSNVNMLPDSVFWKLYDSLSYIDYDYSSVINSLEDFNIELISTEVSFDNPVEVSVPSASSIGQYKRYKNHDVSVYRSKMTYPVLRNSALHFLSSSSMHTVETSARMYSEIYFYFDPFYIGTKASALHSLFNIKLPRCSPFELFYMIFEKCFVSSDLYYYILFSSNKSSISVFFPKQIFNFDEDSVDFQQYMQGVARYRSFEETPRRFRECCVYVVPEADIKLMLNGFMCCFIRSMCSYLNNRIKTIDWDEAFELASTVLFGDNFVHKFMAW